METVRATHSVEKSNSTENQPFAGTTPVRPGEPPNKKFLTFSNVKLAAMKAKAALFIHLYSFLKMNYSA